MLTRNRMSILLIFASIVFLLPANCFSATTDTRTDWSNFDDPTGYTVPYTYNGQGVADEEGSSDSSTGGAAPNPSSIDLSSGSPNGSDPGPYDTPSYGYYDGGTPYDPDDPSTMEDDFIRFTMRVGGDPTQSTGFSGNHWNVLLDFDNDGYK
jgi:hypothetical protein